MFNRHAAAAHLCPECDPLAHCGVRSIHIARRVSSFSRLLADASSSAANIPRPETKALSQPAREVRATGTVQAVHYFVVQTPYIAGQGGQLTLIHLVENGVTG